MNAILLDSELSRVDIGISRDWQDKLFGAAGLDLERYTRNACTRRGIKAYADLIVPKPGSTIGTPLYAMICDETTRLLEIETFNSARMFNGVSALAAIAPTAPAARRMMTSALKKEENQRFSRDAGYFWMRHLLSTHSLSGLAKAALGGEKPDPSIAADVMQWAEAIRGDGVYTHYLTTVDHLKLGLFRKISGDGAAPTIQPQAPTDAQPVNIIETLVAKHKRSSADRVP